MARTLAIAIAVLCGAARAGAAEPAGAAPAAPAVPASSNSSPPDLMNALASSDAAQVERAVATIAQLPADAATADALVAAARACEDKLFDPGRAVTLY